MPYYEVEITATKCICVKADNESEAEEAAADSVMGWWHETKGEAQDEYDELDPKQQEFIAEYKASGDYVEA
jgi:chitinase